MSDRTRMLALLASLALATAPAAAHAGSSPVQGVVQTATSDDSDAADIARAKATIARAKAHRALERATARAAKAHAAAERAAARAKSADDKRDAIARKAGAK
jgi:hypothetical protein